MNDSENNLVLAFDQSTNMTGFSVWEEKTLLEYGLIDLHKNKDTDERFKQMMIEIGRVAEKYHPSLLVMEEVAQQSNVSVLKILARLQGAIMHIGLQYGIETEIIAPTEWRRALGFKQGSKVKRSVLKQQALEHVRQTYKLDVIEDVAEAICIGEAYLK